MEFKCAPTICGFTRAQIHSSEDQAARTSARVGVRLDPNDPLSGRSTISHFAVSLADPQQCGMLVHNHSIPQFCRLPPQIGAQSLWPSQIAAVTRNSAASQRENPQWCRSSQNGSSTMSQIFHRVVEWVRKHMNNVQAGPTPHGVL